MEQQEVVSRRSGSSVKQPLLLVRLLGHRFDLIACHADGGAQSGLVNIAFREDHRLPPAVGGGDLFHRKRLTDGVVHMGLSHIPHIMPSTFTVIFCMLHILFLCFSIGQRQNAAKNLLVGNGKAVVLQKVQIRFGCPFVKHPKAGKLPF